MDSSWIFSLTMQFLHSYCFLLLQIILWVCMKKRISHIFHIPMVIHHCCFPKFQILYVLLLQEIPARISYICRVSLQYIFFLQKTNLIIIQCCLGTTELFAFLAFIWFLSFSFFILQQQILNVLLLQENTCLHFLHLYGFSSLWIFLAENKFEYPLGTAQSLHLCGFSLVWISSIFFIILKILLINFIFKKIWSLSKLIN